MNETENLIKNNKPLDSFRISIILNITCYIILTFCIIVDNYLHVNLHGTYHLGFYVSLLILPLGSLSAIFSIFDYNHSNKISSIIMFFLAIIVTVFVAINAWFIITGV